MAQTQVANRHIPSDLSINSLLLSEQTSEPSAPASGVKIWSRLFCGKPFLSQVGATEMSSYPYQPFLGIRKPSLMSASANTTSITNFGLTVSTTGTNAAQALATTNLYTSCKRTGYTVSSNTAGSAGAGAYSNAAHFFLGSSPGMGGFLWIWQGGIGNYTSGARAFVGFTDVDGTVDTASDYDTRNNILGFCFNATETVWRGVRSDGSGGNAQFETLGNGTNFVCNTSAQDWYRFALFAESGQSSVVYWYAENVSDGLVDFGTWTDHLPAADTLLTMSFGIANGTANGQPRIEWGTVYLETDN